MRDDREAIFFSQILEESLNEIYIFDAENFRFIQVNRGARKNLGYSIDEIRNLSPVDLKPEFTLQSFKKLIGPLIRKEKNKIVFTTIHRRKDGSTYPVEVHLQASTFGEKPVFVAIILDITKRRKTEEERLALEEQLRQSQKMEAIGTLAGGIAHDFNNILTIITGYSELLGENLREDTDREYLGHIQNAAKRAKDLVGQILAFSRAEHHQELTPFNITPILKEALKMMHATIPANIELIENIEDCPPILCDPSQIHQIIVNLCTNASHAMLGAAERMEVSLTTTKLNTRQARSLKLHAGPYLHLKVKDTGRGMTDEVKARIFNPFFTTGVSGKSTGLGLSVVYGIVKNHNGAIYVESRVNKGTTFNIYFPVANGS
ncbi:MAG: ATP-binding protein [Nitrospirota bacterium]|nr:ATP-binding protein [Nitrospirota bacterium]